MPPRKKKLSAFELRLGGGGVFFVWGLMCGMVTEGDEEGGWVWGERAGRVGKEVEGRSDGWVWGLMGLWMLEVGL